MFIAENLNELIAYLGQLDRNFRNTRISFHLAMVELQAVLKGEGSSTLTDLGTWGASLAAKSCFF